MTKTTQALGSYGERLAAEYLTRSGVVVLARNWRGSIGEIDIIGRDGDVLVMCEVKTRRGLGFGMPAEAIGMRKVIRLRRLAVEWLVATQTRPEEIRFDVIEVFSPRFGAPRLAHIKGAF